MCLKKRKVQPKIQHFMHRVLSDAEHKQVDRLLINCFVKKSIPFSVVDSSEFRSFVSSLSKGYRLPHSKKLKGPLLNKLYGEHESSVRQELKDTKHIAVCFDGWTNVVQNKVVNIVACVRHPLLLTSVQVDDSLTSDRYADIIWKTLCDFQIEDKVIQIISDGEKTVEKARQLLVNKSRKITSSYCKSHGLNLLIHDLLKSESVACVCRTIVKILHKLKYNSTVRRTAQRHAEALGFPSLPKVKLPSITRWQYWAQTLEFASNISDILSLMAKRKELLPFFKKNGKSTLTANELKVIETMGNPTSFWPKITQVMSLTCEKRLLF